MTFAPPPIGGGAPQVDPTIAQKAGIPSWEVQDLNTLSSEGALNGVNPNDLVGIQFAEEGYGGNSYGAARSSTGAGGFFGLYATNYSYGGQNFPITPGELSGTNSTDYMLQAQAASASFAQQLQNAHGNVLLAEHYYQAGPNSGTNLNQTSGPGRFKELGLGGNQSLGSSSSTPVSSSGATSNSQGGAAQPIFGVLGGPSVGAVGIFFLAVLVLLIGGFLLVAGTIRGKGGGTVPVPV